MSTLLQQLGWIEAPPRNPYDDISPDDCGKFRIVTEYMMRYIDLNDIDWVRYPKASVSIDKFASNLADEGVELRHVLKVIELNPKASRAMFHPKSLREHGL